MGGPTFANIQTWSDKPNPAGNCINQIIAEATRDPEQPEYWRHVPEHKAPTVLLGDPTTFRAELDAHVAARVTTVRMKDGTTKTRAIRADRHTMAAIVMSYPVPVAAITTDEQRERLASWERRNLEWLRETYGDQLRVVMSHTDETNPHLHAWLLPDDPGADATTLHPGKVAKKLAEAEAKASGASPREAVKIGNAALKARMAEWQDDYYQAVGIPEGLTRMGPKRQRLSREQWKAQKGAAVSAAALLERADAAQEVVSRAEGKAASINQAAQAIAAEAAAGTLEIHEGKIRAKDLSPLRAAPELLPAMRAVASAGAAARRVRKTIADEREAIEQQRRQLAAEMEELKVERRELQAQQRDLLTEKMNLIQERDAFEVERTRFQAWAASMRERLTVGMSRVMALLRRPDLSPEAGADARATADVVRDALSVGSFAGGGGILR